MIKVQVQLRETSQPIHHNEVTNTYQKGDLYCVQVGDVVYKYPIANIWRILEEYGEHMEMTR